eukprot:1131388-Amphidinium_carterae.2
MLLAGKVSDSSTPACCWANMRLTYSVCWRVCACRWEGVQLAINTCWRMCACSWEIMRLTYSFCWRVCACSNVAGMTCNEDHQTRPTCVRRKSRASFHKAVFPLSLNTTVAVAVSWVRSAQIFELLALPLCTSHAYTLLGLLFFVWGVSTRRVLSSSDVE